MLQATGTHESTFNVITCRENGTRHNRRISQDEWEHHRSTIEPMHRANLKREEIRKTLIRDHNFQPTMAQLNTQMQRWQMSHKSHLERASSSRRLNAVTDMLVTYVNDLRIESAGPVIARLNTDREPYAAQFCAETCCAKMVQVHKKLLAASFLSCLQCWSHASDLLWGLIVETDKDPGISISDKVWIEVNHNRLNASIFKSGRKTPIQSRQGLCNISEALRAYLKIAQSDSLSYPLAHLQFTVQYRISGRFEYDYAGDLHGNNREQLLKLRDAIEEREDSDNLLLLLMLWCFKILKTSSRPFLPFAQMKVHVVHVTSAALSEIVLPRMLTCHFMSAWISEPCETMQALLSVLGSEEKVGLPPAALVPELFAAISYAIVAFIGTMPAISPTTSTEELFDAVLNALSKIIRADRTEYCRRISEALLSLFSRSAAAPTHKCTYSEHLAMLTAHKIMGTGYFCKYGTQEALAPGPVTWMCTAECFRVHPISVGPVAFDSKPLTANNYPSSPTHRPRTDSMTSSNTFESRSLSGSTAVGSSPASQSSTALPAVEEAGEASEEVKKLVATTCAARPQLGRSITAGIPQRFPTNSSGRGSLYDFVCTSARATAEQLRRQLGSGSIASRTNSRASRMTLSTQYSFRRVFGIEGSDSFPQRCPTTSSGKMSVDGIEEAATGRSVSRFSYAPGSPDAILVDADRSSTTESSCEDAPALFEVEKLELEPSYVSAWVIQHSAPLPQRSYSAE